MRLESAWLAVRAYVQIATKSFQRQLAYRAANLAGIATNGFFGLIYVSIYIALFRERGSVGGLSLQDTITYAVLTQSLLMTMSAFGNHELSDNILRGDIVTDLSRPVDVYFYWAARDIGRATYYLIFRGIPTFLVGLVLFRVSLPASPMALVWFLISVYAGILTSFAFRFPVSSLAFWTSDARGPYNLATTVIMFFSGFIVPLPFFPAPLRAVTRALPFEALANLPVDCYLGRVDGAALAPILIRQAIWLVALVLIGRSVLRVMSRRLSIHGG